MYKSLFPAQKISGVLSANLINCKLCPSNYEQNDLAILALEPKPSPFMRIYPWLLALIILTGLILHNTIGLYLKADFLSIYLLVLLTVILFLPLFKEMDLLGLKFKKAYLKELNRKN